ncbi:RNA pseudouridine synthase superfamily protein [Babesia caballi]|uniref:RNA pseudouridine synthase superfamily protein n=1 Tax=Babesia caballi TaxID=5871 RepID=A0AAV4M169_BABCB|nr:RNA pseudouridine synthase superfamily protein [Babesia caballi]
MLDRLRAVMTPGDRESAQNCTRFTAPEFRPEGCASEPAPPDAGEQDSFYHDDPQCPCYVCTNGTVDSKSCAPPEDASTGVEFAVRSFWRLAKTQNDVESPMEGHCRGFHYKLLLHPRGTAGTDSEASHLSVFVEASVQDWYPQYWVFPNVRFELTVVNFKDPKQSVTSWAHWSFSSDATSRGWQKMISHSRLTKANGFMDEEGTVLVRGKAEPPYPMLWSNSPMYHPQMMWEYIPHRAQRELSAEAHAERHNGKCKRSSSLQDEFLCHPSCSYGAHVPVCRNSKVDLPHGDPPFAISDKGCDKETCCYAGSKNFEKTCCKGKNQLAVDDAPASAPALPSEPSACGSSSTSNDELDDYSDSNADDALLDLPSEEGAEVSNSTILRFLDSVVPALQPTLDADLLALMTQILYHLREFRKRILMWNPPEATAEDAKSGNGIILALQKTFAYMELYPLAAACKAYQLAGVEPEQLSKYYLYELLPKPPSQRKGYCGADYGDSSCSTTNGGTDRTPSTKYESNVQQPKYDARTSKQKPAQGGRFHIPAPFPKPSDVPGYNDIAEEFKYPRCCYFDGGRYEWELKRQIPAKEGDDAELPVARRVPGTADNTADLFVTTDGKPTNYRLLPGTLSFSIGARGDVFDKLLPPPPNIKLLLKAMHMSDLQVLETQDQLINIHTEFFSMLLRDLAAAKRNLKHKRLMGGKEPSDPNSADASAANAEYALPWYLRDQTDLEVTCKSLFSGSGDSEGLFHNSDANDIANVYIRCKHSHSLQKALENTTKTMTKFPEVLFFYLYPAKNAKKGELFDIPLRLDCTSLCEGAGATEEAFDAASAPNVPKGATAGHNACDSGVSTVSIDYCEYSEEDDEEDDEEEEEAGDAGSENFGNFDGEGKKRKHSAHIKWYSLYALILRESDIRSDGNFHSLLLRPEEDGPWYRIGEGRVEKLTTKMEFTEWKCHRDFFCAAAIYVAEDYIDMLQVGEIDLSGNIKTWNPTLFYDTLKQLGVSEQDISNYQMARKTRKKIAALSSRPRMFDEIAASDASGASRYLSPRSMSDGSSTPEGCGKNCHVPNGSPEDHLPCILRKQEWADEEFLTVRETLYELGSDVDLSNMNIVYDRKVGQRHPRLGNCCEAHGYTTAVLRAVHELESMVKHTKPATKKEVCRRLNRAETVRPFVKWLFHASKENTALLNAVKPHSDGKQLVKFLQQRERYFEEEFCHLISEILLKEIGEHMALSGVYRWETDKSWCGCGCSKCEKNCPAMLLTESGRFAGEELQSLLTEPSTILFRNIQILRCHLEYFCKDCRNLSIQMKDDQRVADIHEFKATSERSALFLIECIWDACVRYTHDCRTILYLKAISDNPSATVTELGLNKVGTLMRPNAIPTAKQTGSLHSSVDHCRDLFVFDGTLSQNSDLLEGEMIDYYDSKYDITLTEELRIMRYFAAKYQLPPVAQMRKFLRENHVLVYCFVRPHELVRAYLEVKCPGENIKGEIEAMVPSLIWNESAFSQRMNVGSLTKEERAAFGLDQAPVSVDDCIGNALCDLYEELITKMLLHMQDAERGLGSQVFDYIYTCGDIARIVSAINVECARTVKTVTCGGRPLNSNEPCTCGSSADCKISPILSNSSYFPDFGVSRGPFSLDFVEIAPRAPYPYGLSSECASFSNEFVDATAKPADAKKKQKTKERKKSTESGVCIIPPLDQVLREVAITQKTAHAADPRLFPDLNEVIKYPNGAHCLGSNGALDKLRRWGEYNSLLYHQSLGYDFNVAGGFATMLKLENHGSKATPNPLLEARKYSEAQAQRIKYAYELGIVTSHDLSGCEGFASEEKLVPTKRLLIYHEYIDEATGKKAPVRVEHLYWGLRKLLQQQVSVDIDSSFVQASKGKKPKGSSKCVCGGRCDSSEYECPVNMRWKPLPRDCFILYALRPDNNNPIRRGRRRFTFMQPELELSHYVDGAKRQVNPKTPDVVVLLVGAPISLCAAPAPPFPLTDDSDYPLLLFKWMCSESVDLVCYGAVVCDAKKQLQHYIFDWLLPLVRDMGVLPKLANNEKEDIERYQILEECSIRTVQNVRRWSCAIRKINKRTGDIIIAQVKRPSDSPATLKLREAAEFVNTVRELAELEALEFLPPAETIDDVADGAKSKADSLEPLDKAGDDPQKLGKKKKKKAAKSAIPSNKKSTFSKSIIPVEDEPESTEPVATEQPVEPERATEVAPQLSEQAALPEVEDKEEEEEDDRDSVTTLDESQEVDDLDKADERIDICGLVDEALEAVASSRTVIDRSALEKRGLPSGRMQDFLQKLDMPNMLVNDAPMMTEMCVYIQRVMEEELRVELGPPAEPSKDQVIVTVGPRTRTCVDILLCLLKSMPKNPWLLTSFKALLDAIYDQAPLAAASVACYTLSAMGNTSVTETMRTPAAAEFVRDCVHKMAEQCVKNCWSVFEDAPERPAICSMLVCLHLFANVNDSIARLCEANSNLLFLMNVVKDRLTAPAEAEEEEGVSSLGFRLDALELFSGSDHHFKSAAIPAAFKSTLSPFGDEERSAKYEQLALQGLKIWWQRRETALATIKRLLEPGIATFILANGDAAEQRRRHVDETMPLSLSIAEAKCLHHCCTRFPRDIGIAAEGGLIHVGSRRASQAGAVVDAAGVAAVAAAFGQVVETRNLRRAVANVALDVAESPGLFADLDEMRLWGRQTALVTMSVRDSGSMDAVTSAEVEAIVQNYYARTVRTIPDPPKLPPQHPQAEHLRLLDRLLDGDEELHRLPPVDEAVVVGERQVHDGPDHHGVVAHDAALEDGVHAQDRGLRRVDDGRAQQAAVDPAVGDGEGPAGHVGQRQLAFARQRRRVDQLLLQLRPGLALAVADHRDHEAGGRGHGDGDVHEVLGDDFVALDVGVHDGHLRQRHGGRLHVGGDEPQLHRRLPRLVDLLAQGHDGAHVALVEGRQHHRGLLRLLQPLADALAHPRHLHPRFLGRLLDHRLLALHLALLTRHLRNVWPAFRHCGAALAGRRVHVHERLAHEDRVVHFVVLLHDQPLQRRVDVHRHLVRLHDRQRLVHRDAVSHVLLPLAQRALADGVAEGGQLHRLHLCAALLLAGAVQPTKQLGGGVKLARPAARTFGCRVPGRQKRRAAQQRQAGARGVPEPWADGPAAADQRS